MKVTVIRCLKPGKILKFDYNDYARVNRYKWCCSGNKKYAVAHVDGKVVYLHRYLLTPPDGVFVDHKNINGLDNRRENLRLCIKSENQINRRVPRRGKYRGIQPQAGSSTFRAAIRFKCIRHHLGSYATEEEAAEAYDRAAIKLHGQFAKLNFPEKNYGADE